MLYQPTPTHTRLLRRVRLLGVRNIFGQSVVSIQMATGKVHCGKGNDAYSHSIVSLGETLARPIGPFPFRAVVAVKDNSLMHLMQCLTFVAAK